MSFLTDLRGISEAAVNQLTDRFGDLPRPLLAAIGAGDFAVERLAELREALAASLEQRAAATTGEARDLAADLPHKVQDAAGEVLESVQRLAADVPARTQHLVDQLPERVADIREALSPEQLKAAVDGYAQLAAVIYSSLADRGDKQVHSALAGTEQQVAAATAAAASATRDAAGAVRTAASTAADAATTAADAAAATEREAAALQAEEKGEAPAPQDGDTVVRPKATRRGTTTPKPAPRPRTVTAPAVEKPAKNKATRAAGAPRRAASPTPRSGGRGTNGTTAS